jgi:hypothetical protein
MRNIDIKTKPHSQFYTVIATIAGRYTYCVWDNFHLFMSFIFYWSPTIEMTGRYANFVVYLTTFSVPRLRSVCMKMLYGMQTNVFSF